MASYGDVKPYINEEKGKRCFRKRLRPDSKLPLLTDSLSGVNWSGNNEIAFFKYLSLNKERYSTADS